MTGPAMTAPRNTSTEGIAPTLASLRTASAVVRTALARLGQVGVGEESQALVVEASEQLTAALHLIDGVGVALRDVVQLVKEDER